MRAGAAGPDVEARELFWFRIGAIVHDVGKLIVPSELLNKPGQLAPDEWELMQAASRPPASRCSPTWSSRGTSSPMVRIHHERWDGQGYPDATRRREHPAGGAHPLHRRRLRRVDDGAKLQGRVVARCRDGDHARDIGAQFDPTLFALFEELVRHARARSRPRVAIEAKTGDRPTVRDLTVSGPNDDLTGVLTRRPFVEFANKVLAERGPFATVSLIVIDVDEFK